MPEPLDRVRAVALQLPGATEPEPGTFAVEGVTFARMADGALLTGEERTALDDDADWQAVEDRVARAWELAAPAGLLEAGGR